MATVNVYTYYTHKLAHQKMPRPRAARRPLRLPRIHPLWPTLAVMLVGLRFLPPARPLAALTGCLLALGLIYLVQFLGSRCHKVWRALTGQSLGADDLRALRGH